jgi:L-lactate dehydrogenase complex protein LldE
MRVALFVTCLVDQFRPATAEATVRVLEQAGCHVEFDPGQTCCGQPAFNAGLRPEALPVCRRTIDRLACQLDDGCDAIVSPSGSCVSMFRHAVELLSAAGDDEAAEAAARVAGASMELGAFLVRRLGVTDLGASWPGRVTWHDACHGLRELGIRDEPRQLLASVAGLELVESRTCDRCCGFGGTFSVDLPGVSTGMADDKIDELETLGIDAVVSGDASCLMQLEGRLEARGSRIRGLHLAEVLAAREPVRTAVPDATP